MIRRHKCEFCQSNRHRHGCPMQPEPKANAITYCARCEDEAAVDEDTGLCEECHEGYIEMLRRELYVVDEEGSEDSA